MTAFIYNFNLNTALERVWNPELGTCRACVVVPKFKCNLYF